MNNLASVYQTENHKAPQTNCQVYICGVLMKSWIVISETINKICVALARTLIWSHLKHSSPHITFSDITFGPLLPCTRSWNSAPVKALLKYSGMEHGQPGNQILQTNSSGARDYLSEDEVENNVFNILQVR
jgi:hypothetical protein